MVEQHNTFVETGDHLSDACGERIWFAALVRVVEHFTIGQAAVVVYFDALALLYRRAVAFVFDYHFKPRSGGGELAAELAGSVVFDDFLRFILYRLEFRFRLGLLFFFFCLFSFD